MQTKHVAGMVLAAAVLLAGVSVLAADGVRQDLKALKPSVSPTASRSPKPSPTPIDVSCVSKAVAARESSLGSGINTFTSATKTAYGTRASALASAYKKTTVAEVRTAVQEAWKQFNTSAKTAGKDWRTAQQAAWKQFKTDATACGSSSTADSGNASQELSGN